MDSTSYASIKQQLLSDTLPTQDRELRQRVLPRRKVKKTIENSRWNFSFFPSFLRRANRRCVSIRHQQHQYVRLFDFRFMIFVIKLMISLKLFSKFQHDVLNKRKKSVKWLFNMLSIIVIFLIGYSTMNFLSRDIVHRCPVLNNVLHRFFVFILKQWTSGLIYWEHYFSWLLPFISLLVHPLKYI